MTLRIGINGFGRIGRCVFRIAQKHKNLEIVAINDLVPPDNLAYLLKYDTVHGRFQGTISATENSLVVNGKETKVFSEKDPTLLPWKDLKVDYVVESTGHFTKYEEAKKHLTAGAKRVVISAPGKDEMPTFVMGVNHLNYNPAKDFVICNASCTTNCLAPMTKVLLDHFGIEEGLMTTVHALTASQPSVDGPSKKDWRGGRAGGYNVIPASTGAAKAVGLCLPQVKGKITGMAFRVPVADVSVVDLTVRLARDTSYEEICNAMKSASEKEMKGIMAFTDEEVVSSDFIGSNYSCIFDKLAGIALNKRFYKLVAWYDNEVGYSTRIIDLLEYMASKERL
ncbi:MAG TPA: type I glyceraldehyde-3-phosphate dehydrogenase [Chlamydiales bacterium]|nr:type I glyceraldehyde-3-phosphate dehydrogenase [Chlamydiales bacterium]